MFSSHRGIYGSQRIDTAKGGELLPGLGTGDDRPRALTLAALAQARLRWLPGGARGTVVHDAGDDPD